MDGCCLRPKNNNRIIESYLFSIAQTKTFKNVVNISSLGVIGDKMVKLIIFDLQGTLIENGVFPSPLKQAKYILRIDAPFSDFVMRFERAFVTQPHASLKDGFIKVCEEFQMHTKDFVLEKLVGLWNKNKLLSQVYPDTVPLLKELKGQYKLVLVANIDCFSKEIIDKHHLREYFDEVILSCDTKILKSDKGFYKAILERFDVETEDALVVGDSIESDMETAKASGIRGILLDRGNRREYAPKIVSLEELKAVLDE
jgi:FMN phosphatase YigB (HAD superfamily)